MKRRTFLTGLTAASAAAVTATALAGTSAQAAGARRAAAVGPEAWMSQFADGTALHTLTIPGTHDSGSTYGGPWTACQNTSIADQLTSGIRFLDIRCRLIDGSFAIHHGPVYQHLNFDDVLGACRDFLTAHSSETVLMRVQQEYSTEPADAFLATFDDYLDNRGWRSLFNLDTTLPDLGGARGKVVLLGQSAGLPGVAYGDPAVFDIQDDYNKIPSDKYPLIEDQFKKAATQPGKFFINFVSTAAALPVDGNAADLNPRVKDLLGSDEAKGWTGLGIVPMDFPNEYGMVDALLAHQPPTS